MSLCCNQKWSFDGFFNKCSQFYILLDGKAGQNYPGQNYPGHIALTSFETIFCERTLKS